MRRSLSTISLALSFVLLFSCPNSVQNGGAVSTVLSRLPVELESRVQAIEQAAKACNNAQQPTVKLIREIEALAEALPRSEQTRRAQAKGRKLTQEALETHSVAAAWRVEAALRALQDEIDHDIAYTNSLKALDNRLYPLQERAAKSRSHPSKIRLSNPANLPYDQMRPGDIMLWNDRSGRPFIRLAVSLYAKDYSHSALYLGDIQGGKPGRRRYVHEAMNILDGATIDLMDRKWKRLGLRVALGHVRGVSPAQAKRIAQNSVRLFGDHGKTPYHTFPPWDKTFFREGVYCSQLTWAPYMRAGIDLDHNDWRYLVWFSLHNWYIPYAAPTAWFGVFPDEIKTSPQIEWYYDGEVGR